MNAVLKPSSALPINPDFLPALAGIETPSESWVRYTARIILRLLREAPADTIHFRWASAHWLRYQDHLRNMAEGAKAVEAAHLTERYQVLTALASHHRYDNRSPLATLFAWIILELHLRNSHVHSQERLSEILRGLCRGNNNNPLLAAIGDVSTPIGLKVAMRQLGVDRAEDAELTGHDAFDRLWRSELCSALDSLSAGSVYETIDDLGREPLEALSCPSGDPDESGELEDAPFVLAPAIEPGQIIQAPRSRLSLAVAKAFERHSTADILRDPENHVPAAVVRKLWLAAHRFADRCFRKRDEAGVQRQLVLLLAMEAGQSEGELSRLCFANATGGDRLALDISGQRLLRPEIRPRQSWMPSKEHSLLWLPTGGDVIFPLTKETTRLAGCLLELRKDTPTARCPFVVVPDEQSGRTPAGTLREALRESSPDANFSPLVFRRRIAAHLCGSLGLDVAQQAFGDAFGMNPTGTYYCRIAVATIAKCLACELGRVTSGTVEPEAWWDRFAGFVGSRAAPAGNPIAELVARLGPPVAPRRGRPNVAFLLAEWGRRRDRLAIFLALATGHRPNESLSQVVLHDIAISHALVILSDKRSDPAHLTRFACTGWGFIHELLDYLAFLRTLMRNAEQPAVHRIARDILSGAAPLFRVYDDRDGFADLDVPTLFSGLPAPWCDKRNLHRHVLCQMLVEMGVDPEWRFAQMGWTLGDGSGSSECAPYSPIEFTKSMATVIDECLRRLGWQIQAGLKPVGEAQSESALVDWTRRIEAHEGECTAQLNRMRALLFEKRSDLTPEIHARLSGAISRVVPGFHVVMVKSRPAIRARDRTATLVSRALFSEPLVRQVLELAAPSQGPAIESIVAVTEFARMLREAISNHECISFVPPVPRLSPSQVPSPFVSGAALAMHQADRIRARLTDKAKIATNKGAIDHAFAAWLSILSTTSYRSLDCAREIVLGFDNAVYAEAEDWVLRVPIKGGHACLADLPAALLTRLKQDFGGTQLEALMGRNEFGQWLQELLPDLVPKGCSVMEFVDLVEQTLRVAGRFELSGIERALLLDDLAPASVSATRAASCADARTVPEPASSAETSDYSDDVHPDQPATPRANPPHRPLEGNQALPLLKLFSNDYEGEFDGEKLLPHKFRRAQLLQIVKKRLSKLDATLSTDVLLLEYLLCLLGEESSGSTCQLSSIYTKAHRFAKRLLGVEDGPWDELEAHQVTTAFHAVLLQSPTKMRTRVLGEIREFHAISARRYDLESPNWQVLCKAAGKRWDGRDAGTLADHEIGRVAGALIDSLIESDDSLTVSLSDIRLPELHRLGHVVLEASGARPRSIYGLSFADFHFGEAGDFIHLKARGRFESQKTPTAAGFIPLEGELWAKERDWVRQWLAGRCGGRDPAQLAKTPVFEDPGAESGRRFPMAAIFSRIGQLVRWSTSLANARTYWLRKRRLQKRHRSVQRMARPMARDVVRMLRFSGHASIHTPLSNYLHDGLCYLERGMRRGASVDMPTLAAISGIKPGTLAQRARRNGHDTGMAGRLELHRTMTLASPGWMKSPPFDPGLPPACETRHGTDLSSIANVMSALSLGWDAVTAAGRCGVPSGLVARVADAMSVLAQMTTYPFGIDDLEMGPPRETAMNRVLLDLTRKSSAPLLIVATEWAHRACRVPLSVGCALIEPSAADALRELLESASLSMKRIDDHGVPVYLPRSGKDAYGLWPALRWVLAVVWVAHRARV